MSKFVDSFTSVPKHGFYEPIFDHIGELRLELYELYGYSSWLTLKKASRKKFRRNK